MDPNKHLRALERKFAHWCPNEGWALVSGQDLKAENLSDRMIERNGAPWVRVGFAMRGLLVATGMLVEYLDIATKLWVRDESKLQSQRQRVIAESRNAIDDLLRLAASNSLDRPNPVELMAGIDAELVERISRSDDSRLDAEGAFWFLTQYRRLKAAVWVLRELRMDGQLGFLSFIEQSAGGLFGAIDESDRSLLAIWIDSYLSEGLMLSWLGQRGESMMVERYGPLFQMRVEDANMSETSIDDLIQSVMTSVDSNSISSRLEDAQNLVAVLKGIARAVSEVGYGRFSEAVTARGGQSGPESMLGNSSAVTVIPSSGRGGCTEVCIAVARGVGTSRRLGFGKVMRELRRYLWRCADCTRVVLIVHDEWDSKAIKENHGDIIELQKRSPGVVFVPILIRGGVLTQVPLGV